MYFLLKRFKGGITYSDFYEMWDDDMWALYKLEEDLVKKELKDNKTSSGTNVPEPEPPEESDEVLNFLRQHREL